MTRRYGHNYTPMWGNSQVDATVCKVDFTNKAYGDKLKSVFYCPSYEKPEGRMCVYWQGRCTVEVGDSVRMIGKFNDGIFLVLSYQILRKGKTETHRHSEPILHRHSEATLRTKRDFGIDLRQIPTPSAQFAEESHTSPSRHSECESRRISELNSKSVETQE